MKKRKLIAMVLGVKGGHSIISPQRLMLTILCIFMIYGSNYAGAASLFDANKVWSSHVTGPWTLGVEFSVGSDDIDVTSLGYFDNNQDGLVASHDVALYYVPDPVSAPSTIQLLTSVTVPSGTSATLNGIWRYVDPATPVTLSSGSHYILASHTTSSELTYLYSSDSAGVSSKVTVERGRWDSSSGGTLQDPDEIYSPPSYYFGIANMKFADPVPTVSEWGMFIFFILLVGSALWVIRRRTTQAST